MSLWLSILLIASAAVIIWLMLRVIRFNPESFSQANLGKSLYTVGVLTLMILVLIVFCIWTLKSG